MPDEVTAQAEETPISKQEAEPSGAEEAKTAAESETAITEETKEQGEKPKGGFQKRIDRLTRRNYELEERLTRLADQHEELISRLAGTKPAAAKAELAAEAKPTVDQFETYEDYVEALADWKAGQKVTAALKERETRATQQTETQRLEQIRTTFNKSVSAAHARYDDLEETLANVTLPEPAQWAIMELDNGVDVAHHLGTHPEVQKQLLGMSLARAVAEIGRISVSLAKAADKEDAGDPPAQPAKPAVSAAPEPIKPVRKASPMDNGELRDDLSADEWLKRRQAQLAKRQG